MNAEKRIALNIGELFIAHETKTDQISALGKQLEALTKERDALKARVAELEKPSE